MGLMCWLHTALWGAERRAGCVGEELKGWGRKGPFGEWTLPSPWGTRPHPMSFLPSVCSTSGRHFLLALPASVLPLSSLMATNPAVSGTRREAERKRFLQWRLLLRKASSQSSPCPAPCLFVDCLLNRNKNKTWQASWSPYNFPVILQTSSPLPCPSVPTRPTLASVPVCQNPASVTSHSAGPGWPPDWACLGSTGTNFFLSLPLSWLLPDTLHPRPRPLHPWASDFGGSHKSRLQPFVWAGQKHLVPGVLSLDRHVAMVRAQPTSLDQVCWRFLINKLSNRKRSHKTQRPSWGRNYISGSWPRIRTRYFLPQEFTLDQAQNLRFILELVAGAQDPSFQWKQLQGCTGIFTGASVRAS